MIQIYLGTSKKLSITSTSEMKLIKTRIAVELSRLTGDGEQ